LLFGADPIASPQHSASGKRGRVKQSASAVMQVLHQRLDKADTASFAALILDLIESTKTSSRRRRRASGSLISRPHIFVGLSLE